jgi:hypothetical protein
VIDLRVLQDGLKLTASRSVGPIPALVLHLQ